LINQRAAIAVEVAKTKIAAGEDGCFYRPDRESLVLRRIKQLNQGPLSDRTAARFFRELMSACLALEKPLQVAFLGPEGTYSQQAVYKHFGHAVQLMPTASIDEVFKSVENGQSQFGIVPVENSTEGMITNTLDRFVISPLKICGELEIKIHHCLMGKVDNLSEVTEIYSHQQSLAQCRKWLDTNLPGITRKSVSSNAEAARLVMDKKGGIAIAGEIAADLYGLTILATQIEDELNNTTRFLVIGEQTTVATGCDKTSILVSTGNQAGALHKMLEPFATYGISMNRIESRPSRQGLWEYVFFIDINGHCDDEVVSQALQALKESTNLFKIVGSYPKASL
jgi:chorismate mutase/prephenate dehydratase